MADRDLVPRIHTPAVNEPTPGAPLSAPTAAEMLMPTIGNPFCSTTKTRMPFESFVSWIFGGENVTAGPAGGGFARKSAAALGAPLALAEGALDAGGCGVTTGWEGPHAASATSERNANRFIGQLPSS